MDANKYNIIDNHLLKHLYKGYTKNKQPLRKIEPRDITDIKINTEPCRQGWLISPQYKYNNKWYTFQLNDKPLIFIIKTMSINSYQSTLPINKKDKLKKALKKWLEEWLKKAHVNLKIDDNNDNKKIIPEKPKRKESKEEVEDKINNVFEPVTKEETDEQTGEPSVPTTGGQNPS